MALKAKERKYVNERRQHLQDHDENLWMTLRGMTTMPKGCVRLIQHIFLILGALTIPPVTAAPMMTSEGARAMAAQYTIGREEFFEDAGYHLFKEEVRSRMDEWMKEEKPYMTVIGFPEDPWNPWVQEGPRMKRGGSGTVPGARVRR